jgi:prevent-host-death family protein
VPTLGDFISYGLSLLGMGLSVYLSRGGRGRMRPPAGASAQRATLCDMRTVTHREMRNQSGDILRHVADGETIQVTNNGRVAALIVPPGTDPLADLVSRGQVRVARNPTSNLRSILRRKGTADSQTIVADVRGRW